MNFGVSLISIIACLCVADLLARLPYFSFLKARESRFETLDGLRGFLAISVFFHHFVVTYYWKRDGVWQRPPEDIYQNYGKVGIAIFFMITGFLFIKKLLVSDGKLNWYKTFESRVFRIFPVYVFAVIVLSFLAFHNSEYELLSSYGDLLKQYLQWALFVGGNINNFQDTRVALAGVDWTLKYEWLFYLSLPVLSYLIHKVGKSAMLVVLCACILLAIKPISFFFFVVFTTKYFVLFAVGGIAAWFLNRVNMNMAKTRAASVVVTLMFVSCIFYPKTLDGFHIFLMSAFFFLVVAGNDMFGVLTAKSSILLGEISYSIYLLHGLVLYALFTQNDIVEISNLSPLEHSLLMPFVSILVVITASLTFALIEKPFIDYGRKFPLTRLISLRHSHASIVLPRLGQ